MITSVHSPDAAVIWLETNFDDPLIKSMKGHGLSGPIAAMLSPEEPALVIFGSILDDKVFSTAQRLAEKSRFPVMIRPFADNPIARWNSQGSEEDLTQGYNNTYSQEKHDKDELRTDDNDVEEDNNNEDSKDLEDRDSDLDYENLKEDGQDLNLNAASSEHHQSSQNTKDVSMGRAWRLRGGAHSSKSWTSETHIVDLGLNISQPSDNYAVQILTEITV